MSQKISKFRRRPDRNLFLLPKTTKYVAKIIEAVKIRISNVVERTRGIIERCYMEKIIKEVENGSFLSRIQGD